MRLLAKIRPIYLLLMFLAAVYSFGIFSKFGFINTYGDEAHVVNSVLKFFRDWHFADPDAYAFPINTILYIPFIALTFIGFFAFGQVHNLAELKQLVVVDTYQLVPAFRIITILFSLLTIYLFYKICQRVFASERLAIIGAYILGTSFIFTKVAFVATKWVPQMLLVMLSIYVFLKFLDLAKWHAKHYFLAGFLIAASFGVALLGGVAVIPFIFVFYKAHKIGRTGNYKKGLWVFSITALLSMLAIVMASPTLAKNTFLFLNSVAESGAGELVANETLSFRLFGYFGILFKTELWLMFLAIPGAIIAYRKNKSSTTLSDGKKVVLDKFIFWLFISLLIVTYIGLGPVLGAVRERRAVMFIPTLAIMATYLIAVLPRRSLQIAALVIFLVNPFIISHELLKDDSLALAKNWIEDNIEADAIIFDGCSLELNPNLAMIDITQKNRPDLMSTKLEYLQANQELLDQDKRFFATIYQGILTKTDLESLKKDHDQYFVFCHIAPVAQSDQRWPNADLMFADLYDDFELAKIYDSGANLSSNIDHPAYFDKASRTHFWYFWQTFNDSYNNYHVTIFKINS